MKTAPVAAVAQALVRNDTQHGALLTFRVSSSACIGFYSETKAREAPRALPVREAASGRKVESCQAHLREMEFLQPVFGAARLSETPLVEVKLG
jgi:hypothetical protein